MKTKYGFRQRKEYLDMCDRIGNRWVEVFEGDAELYSSAYRDLLTEMWRRQAPVRKTDAARIMKAVKSPHTSARYIDTAVAKEQGSETAHRGPIHRDGGGEGPGHRDRQSRRCPFQAGHARPGHAPAPRQFLRCRRPRDEELAGADRRRLRRPILIGGRGRARSRPVPR